MYSIGKLAKILEGKIEGEIKEVRGLAPFDLAKEDEMTFAADEKYLKKLGETKAKAILIPDIQGLPLPEGKTYLKVNKPPRELMPLLLNFFKRNTKPQIKSIEESAKISESAEIGPNCYIGHNTEIGEGSKLYSNAAVMEGVKIGKNVIIYPGVTIREFCTIGDNVIIQPGAVIGSDGFGFVKVNGDNVKIEQIGSVIIEENVEIGANCTIDRGAIGDTIIKRGTKLDNLVHIAHNVIVGEQGLLVAQSGIAGSTVIGKNFVIGGQSGTVGHIKIGDNVSLAAKSGITNNVKDGQILSGYPAIDHKQDLKVKIANKKLPELIKRIKKLEEKLKNFGG